MTGNMIKKHMYALPILDDEKLIGYWPLDEGEGNEVRNLKDGGAKAVPVGNGFFTWTKGLSTPFLEGTVRPDGMIIFLR